MRTSFFFRPWNLELQKKSLVLFLSCKLIKIHFSFLLWSSFFLSPVFSEFSIILPSRRAGVNFKKKKKIRILKMCFSFQYQLKGHSVSNSGHWAKHHIPQLRRNQLNWHNCFFFIRCFEKTFPFQTGQWEENI